MKGRHRRTFFSSADTEAIKLAAGLLKERFDELSDRIKVYEHIRATADWNKSQDSLPERSTQP